MSDQHDTPIKTPKQLITIVILAFVIPISLIGFLVAYVTGGKKGELAVEAQKPQSVAERVRPVAALNLKDANAPKVFQTGEQVFKGLCISCHGAPGIATAPKMGDNAAWAPLIKQGLDAITKDAIKGVRGMPAKGGNPDLDDYEVAVAIVYMANGSGGKFKEPAAPAATPVVAAAGTGAGAVATPAAPVAAPASAPSAALASVNTALPAKVMFASGKSAIDADGKKAIDAATAWLKSNASAKVVISGYVDSSGNAAKNAELAKGRAFAVRDALKAAGIAEDRIALKKPEEIKGGDSAEARRVEISLAAGAATALVATAAPAPSAAAVAVAATGGGAGAGKALYDQACTVCHAAGVANAPKFGDKAAWAPRIATGIDALTQSVLKGKGAMPPKGMAMAASDADIKAAVTYMVGAAK